MTDDKRYRSLSANTIIAELTNRSQRTRLITTSTDKYHSLDYEGDFRSGCRNVSHQQQFFSELHSPGRSHNTNYMAVCGPGGGGVLPYMGYIGMCRCEGYGFQAVYSSIGYINQSVWI